MKLTTRILLSATIWGACVFSASAAEVRVAENFEDWTLGSVASPSTLNGYATDLLGASVIDIGGNKALQTGFLGVTGFDGPPMQLDSFDIAVAAPTNINGVAAKSYMVVIMGYPSFKPVTREIILPSPGDSGLSFLHIDRRETATSTLIGPQARFYH